MIDVETIKAQRCPHTGAWSYNYACACCGTREIDPSTFTRCPYCERDVCPVCVEIGYQAEACAECELIVLEAAGFEWTESDLWLNRPNDGTESRIMIRRIMRKDQQIVERWSQQQKGGSVKVDAFDEQNMLCALETLLTVDGKDGWPRLLTSTQRRALEDGLVACGADRWS